MTRRTALALALAASLPAAAARAEEPKPPAIPADTEVKTTASGLRYSVLREGTGKVAPRKGDRVRVHYTGWTVADGKVFDSSRGKGPAEFAVGGLIEGWNEALCLMTEGAHWKLTIPPALGYGDAGSPPAIPPGATLVFEVELLSLKALPAFRKPDPAAQKTTASGLKYEVLEPGAGDPCGEGDAWDLEFALFTQDGELVEATASTGNRIQGRKADMALPFLKEAPLLMRPGTVLLLEVPPALAFGGRAVGSLPANATTVWRLRLDRIGKPRPVPEFSMPAEKDLRRTPSGLGIRILREGAGEAPRMGEEVVVEYAGWLVDGTVFDSSFQRGLPATFRLGQVIPGWNEGLQAMKPGGEAILVVPAALAYGPRQVGKIPPNSMLVFRVELIEVKK
jgi:FKBP-type peptidyl-prolyl cis-trans isomerase